MSPKSQKNVHACKYTWDLITLFYLIHKFPTFNSLRHELWTVLDDVSALEAGGAQGKGESGAVFILGELRRFYGTGGALAEFGVHTIFLRFLLRLVQRIQ